MFFLMTFLGGKVKESLWAVRTSIALFHAQARERHIWAETGAILSAALADKVTTILSSCAGCVFRGTLFTTYSAVCLMAADDVHAEGGLACERALTAVAGERFLLAAMPWLPPDPIVVCWDLLIWTERCFSEVFIGFRWQGPSVASQMFHPVFFLLVSYPSF